MSSIPPDSELGSSSAPPSVYSRTKPQRTLACVLCQQRKVKCDRKFPCSNCLKFKAECVPAALNTRQRKRRFPERDLLERIRKYEDLLRQNKITFEPLHKSTTGSKRPPSAAVDHDSDGEQLDSMSMDQSSPSTSENPKEIREAKNFWHVLRTQGFPQNDNESESSHDELSLDGVKRAWDQLFAEHDNLLLFGSRKTAVELSTLHPEPVQLFRLWQIYLDNVDPLLKVTHTPSLQCRIIEAASNLAGINCTFEALMFGIYSIAIMSITTDECQTAFGSSREELLTKYQFGCQQALLNCGYLRTGDRECLTAFFLFLVSIGRGTDPRSMSSMLGIAMRIAHRIGIHSEAVCSKHTPLEAEMCRRLWWSFKLFDTRIGELADYKNVALAPTWDCKIPLNVNDSDLRPEMKELPLVLNTSSEAIFVVVRSELREFVRHAKFHFDYHTPNFVSATNDAQQHFNPEDSELDALERMVEDKYLKFCNPENPLHFMMICTTRTYIAKYRLVEHYSKLLESSSDVTERRRDFAVFYAMEMLEGDTKIMTSPLTKGFIWHVNFHFPLPAYIHILQDFKRRPTHTQALKAWEVMSDNFEARFDVPEDIGSPLFKIFARLILPAWDAYNAASTQLGKPPVPPRIVSYIRDDMARKSGNPQDESCEQALSHDSIATNIDDSTMPMPMGSGSYSLPYSGGPDGLTGGGLGLPENAQSDIDFNQLDWALMDWESSGLPNWCSW